MRDYFLREENYSSIQRPPGDNNVILVQRFGELIRKLWNPRNFKAHVSPHEMLQAVVLCSKKKFQITSQGLFIKFFFIVILELQTQSFLFTGDPVEFLSWLLNALHLALNGKKKATSSIVYRTFLGAMKIHSQRIPPIDASDAEKSELMMTPEYVETQIDSPFLFLAADLPPPPLFKDEFRENIIPQVSLFALLSQFNGVQQKEYKTYKENFLKRFELTRLPRYIILNIKVCLIIIAAFHLLLLMLIFVIFNKLYSGSPRILFSSRRILPLSTFQLKE